MRGGEADPIIENIQANRIYDVDNIEGFKLYREEQIDEKNEYWEEDEYKSDIVLTKHKPFERIIERDGVHLRTHFGVLPDYTQMRLIMKYKYNVKNCIYSMKQWFIANGGLDFKKLLEDDVLKMTDKPFKTYVRGQKHFGLAVRFG